MLLSKITRNSSAPEMTVQELHPGEVLRDRVQQHLRLIYGSALAEGDVPLLADELVGLMRLASVDHAPQQHINHWDQRDAIVITYGDTLQCEGEKPLHTLKRFADSHLSGSVSALHLLPFYPWSSDDGFSVLDYSSVNEEYVDVGGKRQSVTEGQEGQESVKSKREQSCSNPKNPHM